MARTLSYPGSFPAVVELLSCKIPFLLLASLDASFWLEYWRCVSFVLVDSTRRQNYVQIIHWGLVRGTGWGDRVLKYVIQGRSGATPK